MADETITLRGLNRAALARQQLLARQRRPILETIEALAGLQAQLPSAPFVGLWSRLEGFRRDELLDLIRDRQVVRATMMRATLHLTTAADYWFLRPALQTGLVAEYNSLARRRALAGEVATAVAAARRFFAEPHTFDEFRRLLEEHHPGVDLQALAYGVRTHLPLVQEPSGRAPWGYPGKPRFVTAESWLGQAIPETAPPRDLILRYLGAFGPARAADLQSWAGMPPLRDAFDELR
ncbi:MAG TPA: crosslink repair DNA glycosylase YcaQ family protein, partial [Thermoleophilia bacterium]|nr:crosslink repair DNA glycosylase YcaQ family protein [Thermoleophilia bacterium]